MRKAYNVYTFNEKTSMLAAFRKFTLLFAFGVCFLGFQTQGSAQSLTYTAEQGVITGTDADFNFLKNFDLKATSQEDAMEILRNQKRIVMDTPAITDAEDLDGLVRLGFLDAAIMNLMTEDVYTSVGRAYQTMAVKSFVVNNTSRIDLQAVVEGYVRLLD